jgi:hypothetical protein
MSACLRVSENHKRLSWDSRSGLWAGNVGETDLKCIIKAITDRVLHFTLQMLRLNLIIVKNAFRTAQ